MSPVGERGREVETVIEHVIIYLFGTTYKILVCNLKNIFGSNYPVSKIFFTLYINLFIFIPSILYYILLYKIYYFYL